MKTIFITGSTDGIGKLTATRFASEGHQVFLHGRNAKKLAATVAELKAVSKNEKIGGFVSDFSDLDSVKKMIGQLTNEGSKIDVLINNAGIFKSKYSLTKDGIDIRLTVNYLAPHLLTMGIMPLMEKGESPRIINLSSAAQSPVSFEALNGNEALSVQEAYAQSKLALTMWSFDLAKRFKTISVLAVNPGSLLNTKMVQEAYGQYWSPAGKGADILFDLAVSEKYATVTGKYFDNDKGTFAPAHSDAYRSEKVAELISVTNSVLANVLK